MATRTCFSLISPLVATAILTSGCTKENTVEANDNPICALGQYNCRGDVLQTCNVVGTGWDDLKTCPPGTCVQGASHCTGDGEGGDGGAGGGSSGGGGAAGSVAETGGAAGTAGAAGSGPDFVLETPSGWINTSAPKDLGAETDRFCALTGVAGQFSTGNDFVRVHKSGGRWVLDATTTHWLYAAASCVSWPAGSGVSVEPPVYWASGTGDSDLGATSGRACFLVQVGGVFNGGAEVIRVMESQGRFIVAGSADSAGVSGMGQCITWSSGPSITAEKTWWWTSSATPVPLGPSANQACWLSGLTGSVKGGGDKVETVVAQGEWYLQGIAQTTGCGGRARCLQW